jgi:hypothetical protein
MALHIAPPQRSIGEEFGRNLATGIGQLASTKLQQMRLANALKQNNYSDAQIALLSEIPENKRLEALQSLAPAGREEEQSPLQRLEEQQPNSELESLLQRSQELGQKPQQLSQNDILQALQEAQQNKLGMGQKVAGPGSDYQALLGEAQRQGMDLSDEQKQKLARKIQDIYADQNKRKALEDDVLKYVKTQGGQQENQKRNIAFKEPLKSQSPFKKPLTTAERIAQETLDLKREEAGLKHKEFFYKSTAKTREAINAKAEAARRRKEEIAEQRNLNRSGKLDTPGYVEFLKRADLDIPALLSPESQEYLKIQQGYLRDAKTYFGGQVSGYEIDQLLKGIATLSNNSQGRERIFAAMDKLADADIAYQTAMKEVIRQNPDILPLDLDEQISDRIGDKLKKIGKEFKANIKEIEALNLKEQNPLITALQAGAGELVGAAKKALPGAAKGAAAGALAGSAVPGLGTGAGALLGGLYGAIK